MTAGVSTTPLGMLLLEDSPADSRLLVESLRDYVQDGSLVIQTVRLLADALRELKRFRFSCVLVDLGLPDGQGVANVARIREADPHIAIVVLTGLSDERAQQEAFRMGAQDYLIKGERLGEDLLSFVRKAVSERPGGQSPSPEPLPNLSQPALRYRPYVDLVRSRFSGLRCLNTDGWRPGCIGSSIATLAADLQSWHQAGFNPGMLWLSLESDGWSAAVNELSAATADHMLAPEHLTVRVDIGALAPASPAAEELQRLANSGFPVWVEGWRPDTAMLDRVALRAWDGLVVDMSTLSHLAADRVQRFLRGSLAMCGALGMSLVLENIVSEAHQQHARSLGVRWVGGDRYCGLESSSVLPLRWRRGPSGLD